VLSSRELMRSFPVNPPAKSGRPDQFTDLPAAAVCRRRRPPARDQSAQTLCGALAGGKQSRF
jgi:hypothetical protein